MGRRSEEKLAKVGVKAPQADPVEQPVVQQTAVAEPSKRQPQASRFSAVKGLLGSRGAEVGICLVLILATAAVFGQTLGHDFVAYDDDDYVYANRHVRGGLT